MGNLDLTAWEVDKLLAFFDSVERIAVALERIAAADGEDTA